MCRALLQTLVKLKRGLKKVPRSREDPRASLGTVFWDEHKDTLLFGRQRLMLNKLLDGFDGKLKTSKWAKISKTSTDTALRDIKDLIEKGILRQEESGGRSTNYELVDQTP